MKLLSLNIEGDKHLQERIFPLFEREKANVLCLQEVFQEDLPLIAEKSQLNDYIFVPQARIKEQNPHLPARGAWGLAIFAQEIISSAQHYYVGRPDILPEFFANGNPNSMNRILLIAKVQLAGKNFQIATTHFTWSGKGEVSDLQCQNFCQLKKHLAQYPELILCGDFNTPRGGEIYDELAILFQDNIPQEIDTTIDCNLHKSGQDIHLVVDALCTSPQYSVSQVKVISEVSDHMAVAAEIDLM